ncbi:3'-5' exonuclease [Yoonia sp. I 8.24]|uniref:3'-5' exonuclease n=1 Tax=Yoonia sp. I 8.24 TaxID=1537229 RepID=UPI00351D65FC
MVSPEAEPFEHAEERRVMYVAMTRARKTLTIMGSAAKPSVFVEELMEDAEYGLLTTDIETAKVQTCGECQGHLQPIPKREGSTFYRCEHVQLCGNMMPCCPGCGVGFPVRSKGKVCAHLKNGGAIYQAFARHGNDLAIQADVVMTRYRTSDATLFWLTIILCASYKKGQARES